jgi:glyoxylase-like metal-dependent hydrolase (beta-lactamase superfamily II)
VPNETVNFEVYALKYATRDAQGSEHFYGHDIHDYPMPMDYFVWAVVSDEYSIVVDAGFTTEVAARRGREHLRCPAEGLQQLGIHCARVSCVILTHLHYDHVGNLEKVPAATFVVQDEEMAFAAYTVFSSWPWETGVLEPKIKELIYTAFDVSATHMFEPGLRQHIRNALALGATKEEIMEVFELASIIGAQAWAVAGPPLQEALERAGTDLAREA